MGSNRHARPRHDRVQTFNNVRGVYCTVFDQEHKAKSEVISLFEEYEEKILEQKETEEKTEKKENSGDEGNLESDKLAKELEEVQKEKFVPLKTGVRGSFFVRFKGSVSPVEMVRAIFADFVKSGDNIKTRHISRMYPIESTFTTKEDFMKKKITETIKQKVETEEEDSLKMKTYSTIAKCVNSNKYRSTFLKNLVKQSLPPMYVPSEGASILVVLIILKTTCFLSVVKDAEELYEFSMNKVMKLHGMSAADLNKKSQAAESKDLKQLNEESKVKKNENKEGGSDEKEESKDEEESKDKEESKDEEIEEVKKEKKPKEKREKKDKSMMKERSIKKRKMDYQGGSSKPKKKKTKTVGGINLL